MKREVSPLVSRSQQALGFRTLGYDPSKVARVDRVLSRRNEHAEEVLDAISSLTDAELTSFGLRAFQINMLSILGEFRSARQIGKAARAAAINKLWLGWEYFHDYLPGLAAAKDGPHLRNLPIDVVEAQLVRGRGLVVVTFHQGHFHHIASDLAIAGVPVCMPLAGDAFHDFTAAIKTVPEQFRAAVTAVNVEKIRGSFHLAKVLSNGGCICATIDGNTGLDGPRGDTHRVVVKILGCRARVKTGLIRMAAAYGAPILPLFAHTIGAERKCHTAPLIDPGGPLSGEEAERFAEEATRRLYAHFGKNLLSCAEQWSGCDHFHLWRVPDAPAPDRESVGQQLMRDLEASGRATMNTRRIVELSREDDLVWADVKTLQCYRLPGEMRDLVARLSNDGGVDLAWLGCHEEVRRSRMCALMRQLAARGAIQSHGGPPAGDGPPV